MLLFERGFEEYVVCVYMNLVLMLIELHEHVCVELYFDVGIVYCSDCDFDVWCFYMLGELVVLQLV